MLHHRDGACVPPDVTLGIQAKEFNLGFFRPEDLVSHCLSVFRCLLANSKWAVMCLFNLGVVSVWPLYRKGLIGGVLQRWFSHLHNGTLELCQSDHRVLGHLPDQGPSPLIAQFGWTTSSRKSLGGPKLLPFKNDRGHCVLGDLQCCRNILVPFPRSAPRHNHVSELFGQFLQPGLVFALTCTVNCGTLYRQVCAFPNHAQSIEFTTGGLQSSCRNISRMIHLN